MECKIKKNCLVEYEVKLVTVNDKIIVEKIPQRFFVDDFKKYLEEINYPDDIEYKVVEICDLYLTGMMEIKSKRNPETKVGPLIFFRRRIKKYGFDDLRPFSEECPLMVIDHKCGARMRDKLSPFIMYCKIDAAGRVEDELKYGYLYLSNEYFYFSKYDNEEPHLMNEVGVSPNDVNLDRAKVAFIRDPDSLYGKRRRDALELTLSRHPAHKETNIEWMYSTLLLLPCITIQYLHRVITLKNKFMYKPNKIMNELISSVKKKDTFIIRGAVFATIYYSCQHKTSKVNITNGVILNETFLRDLLYIARISKSRDIPMSEIINPDELIFPEINTNIHHFIRGVAYKLKEYHSDIVKFPSTCTDRRMEKNDKLQKELENIGEKYDMDKKKKDMINSMELSFALFSVSIDSDVGNAMEAAFNLALTCNSIYYSKKDKDPVNFLRVKKESILSKLIRCEKNILDNLRAYTGMIEFKTNSFAEEAKDFGDRQFSSLYIDAVDKTHKFIERAETLVGLKKNAIEDLRNEVAAEMDILLANSKEFEQFKSKSKSKSKGKGSKTKR